MGTLAVTFSTTGAALIAETGHAGGVNASTIASYAINPSGTLASITVTFQLWRMLRAGTLPPPTAVGFTPRILPGTSSINHLQQNLDAAGLELPSDVIAELNTIGKNAVAAQEISS
jgi:hypothetical protein